MKKQIIFSIFLLLIGVSTTFGQVGIGTENPNLESVLDLVATNKGFLPPRITEVERDNIANPAEGLIIYNTTQNCLNFYDSTKWTNICEERVANVFTISSPTYQGVSVINTTGIGYNGEAVPVASTITVQATVDGAMPYVLVASHSGTGLVYSATGNFTAAGTYAVILTPNNVTIPITTYGTLAMTLLGADNTLELAPRIDIKSVSSDATLISTVTSPATGRVWMDRNLGTRRAATSSADPLAYGDTYQWGRYKDGHEIMVLNGDTADSGRGLNGNTTTLSTSDTPNHPQFIGGPGNTGDWRNPQNANLWQGTNGTNNPCPSGFRLPTETEWDAEFSGNSITDAATAFSSFLKLPVSGYRHNVVTTAVGLGSRGSYWSSSANMTYSFSRSFTATADEGTNTSDRARGYSVRCIQN